MDCINVRRTKRGRMDIESFLWSPMKKENNESSGPHNYFNSSHVELLSFLILRHIRAPIVNGPSRPLLTTALMVCDNQTKLVRQTNPEV